MQKTILRIAHVSDVHMLARPGGSGAVGLARRFVSLGRPLDVADRARRFLDALTNARKTRADHVVVSGDLTELGDDAEYEQLAEVLDQSGIEPDRVTLVPGNHDAYASRDAWRLALEGPLAKWAPTSATSAGKLVDRGDVCFLPIDATVHQAVTRSAGELTDATAEAIDRRLDDPGLAAKAIVVVAHHPPYGEGPRFWQWIDAMRGGARLLASLARRHNVYVLHGHLHRAVTRVVERTKNRLYGAPAVVDAPKGAPAMRFYDVVAGELVEAAA